MSGNNDQYRFDENGELEEPDDDEPDEEQTNDFGEEMPWYETKGGFRRDVMSSLFQKAVRRSDDETAAFAAWELVRSGEGYETHYWNRAVLACIEDLVAGNEATEHVLRYEDLAKNRYTDNGWARRLCAIAAAMVCARARSGREATHANGYFSNTMVDRARAQQDDDHEPLYEPPVTDEDLESDGKYGFIAKDKHTYPGAGMGRGWAHFRIHGARCSNETDQWGYTETEPMPAMRLTDLSKTEANLVEAFVPVAVDEAGGFAGFRENATKTNSLVDRLEAITLPDPDDVADDLERYREAVKRAEELDEKIQRTDDLIDEIVYDLYGLTDEEIEIVEDAVNGD